MVHRIARLRSVKLEEEYSVQFESYATFLAYFKAKPGLTEEMILQRAMGLAREAFGEQGNLTLERSSREGSFAFSGYGIDKTTAKILAPHGMPRPKLFIVK